MINGFRVKHGMTERGAGNYIAMDSRSVCLSFPCKRESRFGSHKDMVSCSPIEAFEDKLRRACPCENRGMTKKDAEMTERL